MYSINSGFVIGLSDVDFFHPILGITSTLRHQCICFDSSRYIDKCALKHYTIVIIHNLDYQPKPPTGLFLSGVFLCPRKSLLMCEHPLQYVDEIMRLESRSERSQALSRVPLPLRQVVKDLVVDAWLKKSNRKRVYESGSINPF